ncbi:MAG TPA: glucoamylase family protein [Chitinophagaceae bacterium]
MHRSVFYSILALVIVACKKGGSDPVPPEPPAMFALSTVKVDGISSGTNYVNVKFNPVIRASFGSVINRSSVSGSVTFKDRNGATISFATTYENNDSTIVITPSAALSPLTKYNILFSTGLQSKNGGKLNSDVTISLFTHLDSTRKFPAITDDELLTLVQQQTFKYFWDFGHPVSGLARERNSSGDIVTSGGSGFGIMAIITGIHRNFITRAQGLSRMQTIVGFLKNTAQTFKGAYPHWLNGNTGQVIPFSTKDNGADLVETSYLIQGLLCARQYFNGSDASEAALRNDINFIWNRVEWDFFRKNNENVLYWHWSPDYQWDMNMPVRGWNEALITYVLAASSASHPIPKIVYDNGWAQNGAIKNNNSYYGYQLPLGPAYGGPLFFEHYSFLGINPNGLSDVYANYTTQTHNHTLINYNHCKTNPNHFYGYSDSVWGLTASDIPNGYTASSPANDIGVIAPTAAISSFPYTPLESMKALKFFYYVLGDKIWKQYGFVDAFSLNDPWFADSFLAIDQGPVIIMIENHRSGLLWNLFTSCPEVKSGMLGLGFTAPYL